MITYIVIEKFKGETEIKGVYDCKTCAEKQLKSLNDEFMGTFKINLCDFNLNQ